MSSDRHLRSVPDPAPTCPVCGLTVITGDLVHHSCETSLSEPVAPPGRLFGWWCTVCGRGVPKGRVRCETCPAPELPESYRDARARLEAHLAARRPA